jgi:hypothetical protein
MQFDKLLRRAVEELQRRQVPFAIAGGLAAGVYRPEPRLTNDIDISILAGDVRLGRELVESLGLSAGVVRQADLAGGPLFAIRKRNTEPCMIVGRRAGESGQPGVDLLLPAIPWVPDAVRRAQNNRIDYGFGAIPTITIEDVIVAKLAALKASPTRWKDLDDLTSIFSARSELDLVYLTGQMRRFDLVLPDALRAAAPGLLAQTSREIQKECRQRLARSGRRGS